MKLSIKIDYDFDGDDSYPIQQILYGYVCIPDVCIGQIEVSNSGEWFWMEDEERAPLVTQFLDTMTKEQYAIFEAEIKKQNQEYVLKHY